MANPPLVLLLLVDALDIVETATATPTHCGNHKIPPSSSSHQLLVVLVLVAVGHNVSDTTNARLPFAFAPLESIDTGKRGRSHDGGDDDDDDALVVPQTPATADKSYTAPSSVVVVAVRQRPLLLRRRRTKKHNYVHVPVVVHMLPIPSSHISAPCTAADVPRNCSCSSCSLS